MAADDNGATPTEAPDYTGQTDYKRMLVYSSVEHMGILGSA